jgi:hypothetical protein
MAADSPPPACFKTRPRIRIVGRPAETPSPLELSTEVSSKFWEVLEQRAQDTVSNTKGLWGSDAESFLAREISLALSELDRARDLHERLCRSLSHQESYVNLDMRYLNRPKYPVFPVHERRDHLKQKLARIEKERRQIEAVDQQRIQILHERLLSLWHKHRQLNP